MTTKYYLIAHLPVPNDPHTYVQRFDDKFALADYLHNEIGFEREDCITEVGHEPDRLSGHEHLIIKGELIQWPTWPYKPNLRLVET